MKPKIFLFICLSVLLFSARLRAQPETPPDVWTRVQSKNFELIGNASGRDIRAAATKLEQFRAILRQIFPRLNFDSTVPTRVVVFKDAAAFEPFKPVRADGTIDAAVKGTFLAGVDTNYITLAVGGEQTQIYSTIFHEYIHFIVNNNVERANLPTWFNEGIAKYYENLRLENDRKIIVGAPQPELAALLQQPDDFIDFDTFLKTDNYELHRQGNHGRSVFYAEAWAFVHYLQTVRRSEADKFFDFLLAGKKPREAFVAAFETDAENLEKDLRDYIKKRSFQTVTFNLPQKLTFDAAMNSAPVSEAAAETVLGDLLLHSNRLDEAVVRLSRAAALDENSADAHAALGTAWVKKHDFERAKIYFERAVRLGSRNFLPHYAYAFALGREEADEFGYVKSYPPEKAAKIRALLTTAIKLKPDFADSYSLLALTNLVTNERLDEAVALLGKARALAPANEWYEFGLAQVFLRQTDYDAAERIAERVYSSTADKDLRLQAEAMLISVRNIRAQLKSAEENANRKQNTEWAFPVISQEEGLMRSLNKALRKPPAGEKRAVGYLTRIECDADGTGNTLVVRLPNNSLNQITGETLKFRAAELRKISMIAFVAGIEGSQIGCGVRRPENFAVITYRPFSESSANGEVTALEFVPENFRFIP